MTTWDQQEDLKRQLIGRINLQDFPALGTPPQQNTQLNIPQVSNTSNITLNNQESQQLLNTEPTKVQSEAELTDLERYGLKGLVPLLTMATPDKNTFALGTDLSILGLDISSSSIDEKISKTFSSPWIETSRSEVEPFFRTPNSFKIENVGPLQEKLSLFTDETLFYIFYTKPKDILQELTARELMVRNWRYHKDLQVWLTKELNTEPVQQSPTSERGFYIFFDPSTWEKVRKEFILYYQSIMS
ncbi:hypothetical protein WICMUC_003006 [Wickerhamomyces mucosus]|uniref:NOT2/NOT3/NOT5 C-terminal domain-containing protein n=1 Tax=Wickerhamomyces mucosus TaxID=1378264 RepID=A0A9P8PM48_9ASCO|nr:hypothetical protein WICMUC_003006 [Wickerhamomyces mucosus]